MKEFADLITAISSLLWPVAIFAIVFLFKQELSQVIMRVKKGKFFGTELELEQDLTSLKSEVEKLEPPCIPENAMPCRENTKTFIEENEFTFEMLSEAAKFPKLGLIVVSSQIEKELRALMLSMGDHEMAKMPVRKALATLELKKMLSPSITSSVDLFWDVRNRVVHGKQATDDDALRAIDVGITILRALRSIPHESHFVHHPGVPVYGDDKCTLPREGVKGVILRSVSPGGISEMLRIFPTKKPDYKKGEQLSWEWNISNQWHNTWYKDPDTNQIKEAWSAACEFTGRNLHL